MLGEHPGAGAARRDDPVAGREGLDRPARDRPGRGAIARIVGGLAATGLGGNDDFAARLLQQRDRGEADARAHEVDEASDEEPDADRRLHGFIHGGILRCFRFRRAPARGVSRAPLSLAAAHPKLAP